jgi:hypothetical protein
MTSFGGHFAAFGGSLLKSAYVTGVRKLSELRKGQVVRLAGSGACVVESIWTVGNEAFGHFRCQDGLVVLLTEAEEFMIGTLTKQGEAAPV